MWMGTICKQERKGDQSTENSSPIYFHTCRSCPDTLKVMVSILKISKAVVVDHEVSGRANCRSSCRQAGHSEPKSQVQRPDFQNIPPITRRSHSKALRTFDMGKSQTCWCVIFLRHKRWILLMKYWILLDVANINAPFQKFSQNVYLCKISKINVKYLNQGGNPTDDSDTT